MKKLKGLTVACGWLVGVLGSAQAANDATITSYVDLVTSKGTMTLGLYGEAAPITTENFLQYVNANLYGGTMIHRLLKEVVWQGGWVNVYGQPIKTFAPIQNEAGTSGLSNVMGTIAMARTSDPHSATSQFFFNLVDNAHQFDYGTANAPAGYAVFGSVLNDHGLSVMKSIGSLTPFNSTALPFPVSPTGQMVTIAGTYAYSLEEGAVPTLRVLINGTGKGSVRSAPGGVCKAAVCNYNNLRAGQKITLTATPVTGSYFAGWSGDCIGGEKVTRVVAPKTTPSSVACIAKFNLQ